ncbi:Fez family zinc finger protein 2 [Podospora conica]|nr:Fez family zinc finger protein 2 [Schizothecium conicum]
MMDSSRIPASVSDFGLGGVDHHARHDSFDWLSVHDSDHHHHHHQHGAPHHHRHQSAGDAMDMDIDIDSLSWTDDLDTSFADVAGLDLGLDHHMHDGSAQPEPVFGGAGPLDPLFAEDEAAFPTYVHADPLSDALMHDLAADANAAGLMLPPIGQWHPADLPHPSAGMDDPTPDRLRSQMLWFSEGSCGDEIVFKNCDSSKAMLLHGLSLQFGLNYSHDASTGMVSVTRTVSDNSMSFQHTSPLIVVPSFPGMEFSQMSVDTSSLLETAPSIAPSTVTDTSHQLSRRPSRSQRISDSISKHVSTWRTSMAKSGGRRGPLTEDGRRDMRVLEGAGGACWRCKVLRRKCDPGSGGGPCRCCLQAVPMQHLGEDAPLWPLIGCRRGPLRDALALQVLCPGAMREPKLEPMDDDYRPRRSLDLADRCLLSAEGQRLSDIKAVLECASYKISISDPTTKQAFVSFVETGRYRTQESLHKSLSLGDETVTYTELIATIAWELAENQALVGLLEMTSWESFTGMLETACIYESEVGQTSLVMLSMVCLRHCLEALRLHSAGLLTKGAHGECMPGQCQVQCIQDLSYYVESYINELSSVVFNKENMRDRRWWLSTFYSLYIQSYVRQALIVIEKQLCFDAADDVPAEDLTSAQYLHLAAILFTAASAKYDPLLGGRFQYALTENSVIPETSVPEMHHSSARIACEVEKWPEGGVKTSYQFLRRLLQIGSVDFEAESTDVQPLVRTSSSSGRRTPETLRPSTSSRQTIHSAKSVDMDAQVGTLVETVAPGSHSVHAIDLAGDVVSSPKKIKRWSAETECSIFSATFSTGNASSGSLARTLMSDVTSIAEEPEDRWVASEEPIHEASPAELAASHLSSPPASLVSPCHVCHCCPRTPQRFRSLQELRKHETEKPHPCTLCKRRFKSPAEADRHTKAVHIKSHYWTCKAMENPLVVFHQETHNDVVWDVCGLCGGGFVQSGEGRSAELLGHLEGIHHYGECNREKEFYRVDNFRQHLKTTHEAKQGKWLKDLEARCRTTTAATINEAGPPVPNTITISPQVLLEGRRMKPNATGNPPVGREVALGMNKF